VRRQTRSKLLEKALPGTAAAVVGPSTIPFTGGCTMERNSAEPGQGEGVQPAYLALHRVGELVRRADDPWRMMAKCRLCPRQCGVNRIEGQEEFCRVSSLDIQDFRI